jgi:hypothetical protein
MSLLLSDIHLPALITSTLSEHSTQPLPWNNLDQLSCLWGGKFFLVAIILRQSDTNTLTLNSLHKMQKEY